VCEEDCAHVAKGMTPEQVRNVLLALQAEIDSIDEYLHAHASEGDIEWACDERDTHRDELKAFVRLVGSPALAAHFKIRLLVEAIEPDLTTK
jgi:hypothetical protein